MSQLIQIRQKIRSIQTTRKITHAVRLVSMSLYNKLDKANVPLKNYTKNIKNVFVELLPYAPEWKSSLLFPGDIMDTQPLFIIVATSKGLCGSLNSNLLRYIDASLFVEKQQAPRFIAIGQKAMAFVREKDLGAVVCTYPELSSNNFIALAEDLVEKIVNSDVRYSSVSFYSSEAKSFFAQRPGKSTLIPMSLEPWVGDVQPKAMPGQPEQQSLEAEREEREALIWEQEKGYVLDYLAIRYLRSSIIHLLFQALRAEHNYTGGYQKRLYPHIDEASDA